MSYPLPWRWEPNGASEALVAADGSVILGGPRISDPIVRVALQHATETAKSLHDLTSPDFTSCERPPGCGVCTCCIAFNLFNRMCEEINALRRRAAGPAS